MQVSHEHGNGLWHSSKVVNLLETKKFILNSNQTLSIIYGNFMASFYCNFMCYVCELLLDYIASLVLLKTISSREGEFYVAFIICLPFDMSIDRFIV